MEREKEYLLHLLGAYLRGDEPQIQPDVDWERLRQLARIHNLAGVLAYLEMKYPVCQDRQAQAAHRKFCMSTIAGFAQRGSLAEAFSQTLSDHGIDHIMMKGFVIRDFYPVPELRSYGDAGFINKSGIPASDGQTFPDFAEGFRRGKLSEGAGRCLSRKNNGGNAASIVDIDL